MQNIMGFSVRLTVATLVAVSYSSAFGFWEDKSGEVKITSGAVSITEGDKPSAEVTKITVAYGATLWITNLTTKWEMTTPISGGGKLRIKNCADKLIVNADNRDYVGAAAGQPGCFAVEDALTTVIVSNRYGLGSSSFKKAASAFAANSFKFGGAGLTNDVAITGGAYAFTPQWPDETGTFVQNASLGYNMFKFRNAEMTAGTLGTYNTAYVEVESGCSLAIGTNVHVVASTSPSGAALGLGSSTSQDSLYYWGTSQTNKYRYAQVMGAGTHIVCIGENAFNTDDSLAATMGYLNVHNTASGTLLDLNGYDQKLPWIQTYTFQSDKTHLSITSAAPATLTFTCRDAAAKAGDLVFYGAASFCYAGVAESSYTWKYGNSVTTGKLSVKSGTFIWGAATGVDTIWGGPEVEASGTGTLQLMAKSKFGYVDEKGTNASRLTISDSATVNLPAGVTTEVGYLVAGGKEYRKGIYGSQEAFEAGLIDADHVVPGLSGTGLLKVLRSPFGLMILFR